MERSTLEGSWLPSKRLKKETPNFSKPLKGKSGWTDKAFPGMVRSSGPLMSTYIICFVWWSMRFMVCEFNERAISNLPVKRSVVGSGPIRCPGKSRPSRYRIKEVFPTEYCPIKRTCGLAKTNRSWDAEYQCETIQWFSPVWRNLAHHRIQHHS